MLHDIEEQGIGTIKRTSYLVFIRFLNDNKSVKRSYYFLKNCADVMDVITQYLNLKFCDKSLRSFVRTYYAWCSIWYKEKINLHFIKHCQALAAKTTPDCFALAMKISMQVLNFIKKSARNTRLFRQLYSDMNSEYGTLLYHTVEHWISKVNILTRLYELRVKVQIFLKKYLIN